VVNASRSNRKVSSANKIDSERSDENVPTSPPLHENPIDQLTISVEVVRDVSIVNISGETNIYNSKRFQQEITKLIKKGAKTILIDATALDYMETSGIASLITASAPLIRDGGSLSLCNCKKSITSMLNITRLDRIFRAFNSREEAFQSLARTST